MKRVAIVGGGLSGIAATYQLTRDGAAECALFESSPRLGGIVETERMATPDGNFIIECGPDSWVTEKPWARELAIELGLESEIIPSNDYRRRTYLLEDRRLIPIPDGMRLMVPSKWAPIMESPLFTWQARLAYLREARRAEELKQSALPPGDDESIASFVRRHFGDEVTQTLTAPLLAGVFGGSIDTLSVRAVMPAFVAMEQKHGSLIAALQNRGPAKEQAAIFTTLRSGLETLIERMTATLPANAVRLNHEVTSLARRGDHWQLEAAGSKLLFDEIILATPAHVTRQLLRPTHADFASLLAMDATSAIVVALAFTADQAKNLRIPRGFGYLTLQRPRHTAPDPDLLACTFVDQKFPHRAPEGAVLLRGFFGGDAAPALLGESDAQLTSIVHRQLARTLGPLPDPAISIVRRWPLSLPQYAVGHLTRMEQLAALTASIPGLHLIGNAYHGVGVPDMIRLGRDTARRIAQN
jgi:oxygen-dependent protoporphyrinogen oxidase